MVVSDGQRKSGADEAAGGVQASRHPKPKTAVAFVESMTALADTRHSCMQFGSYCCVEEIRKSL